MQKNTLILTIFKACNFMVGWILASTLVAFLIRTLSASHTDLTAAMLFIVIACIGISSHVLWIIIRQLLNRPFSLTGKILGGYFLSTCILLIVGIVNIGINFSMVLSILLYSMIFLLSISIIEFIFVRLDQRAYNKHGL